MADITFEEWGVTQDYTIPLDIDGRIIDFLDSDIRHDNKPEERVRQRTVKILHHELGYPKELIAIERAINIGTRRPRPDIIVYLTQEARAANDQGQINLILETKAPSESEPDGQLVSYLTSTSASGGAWTNGETIHYLRKDVTSGEIITWIGIPKFGEPWDAIGSFKKRDLIPPIDLKLAFRRCHNAIYRSGIDSEDVALDMVRIILAKIEDESSSNEDCQFRITPEEYHDSTTRTIACERVRRLFAAVKQRYQDVFGSSEVITASDDQLAIVISHLQRYSFLDASYDVIGTAYEVYVASHLKGERGQYFTNRLVVNMMVRMVDPHDKDIVLDPACGSGGFLISAMNYIFETIDKSGRNQAAKDLIKRNVCHNIFGVDTSPKLVKVAKANMLLSRDGHTGIARGNSLGDLRELPEQFKTLAGIEKPSVILTNPPFGSGYELRIREGNVLQRFRTGHMWTTNEAGELIYSDDLNTGMGVAPEVLFLERCIEWVKPGGTIAIVMAKGQLDNREAYAMRRLIFDTCRLLAVVNLHEDTFEPFTGAKASVIFLQKRQAPLVEDYRIFMAVSMKVGQTSRGEPILKRDAEGEPIVENNGYVLDEDLTDIAEAYHRFLRGELTESDYQFSIPRSQIKPETLSLNPVQYLPAHNAAVTHVLALGESDDFEVRRLGDVDVARVFNGPRFKRPYADHGVTEGPTIRKYFTGTALTQLNADNVKYLDSSKATPKTLQDLAALTIYRGYILISDSGTLGRVTYALTIHDGHVATNNLIRVVVQDEHLRGYIYQFLRSEIGQRLMLKNAYGTNQEHLEPDVIAEIPIPIPTNREVIKEIGSKVIRSIELLEQTISTGAQAAQILDNVVKYDEMQNS